MALSRGEAKQQPRGRKSVEVLRMSTAGTHFILLKCEAQFRPSQILIVRRNFDISRAVFRRIQIIASLQFVSYGKAGRHQ